MLDIGQVAPPQTAQETTRLLERHTTLTRAEIARLSYCELQLELEQIDHENTIASLQEELCGHRSAEPMVSDDDPKSAADFNTWQQTDLILQAEITLEQNEFFYPLDSKWGLRLEPHSPIDLLKAHHFGDDLEDMG